MRVYTLRLFVVGKTNDVESIRKRFETSRWVQDRLVAELRNVSINLEYFFLRVCEATNHLLERARSLWVMDGGAEVMASVTKKLSGGKNSVASIEFVVTNYTYRLLERVRNSGLWLHELVTDSWKIFSAIFRIRWCLQLRVMPVRYFLSELLFKNARGQSGNFYICLVYLMIRKHLTWTANTFTIQTHPRTSNENYIHSRVIVPTRARLTILLIVDTAISTTLHNCLSILFFFFSALSSKKKCK